MVNQETQIIIDPKTMGPELLETVIQDLLHPEEDQDNEEDDIEE